MMVSRNGQRQGLLLLAVIGLALLPRTARAAPEAHVLRIDPRTSVVDGKPTITTVIDLTDAQRASQITRGCAGKSGDEQLDCMSEALEAPGAWGKAQAFVPGDVYFSVKIEESSYPAELLHYARFGESHDEPRVGTAYLLVVDADARGGKAFDELKAVATQFVQSMGTNDWVDVIYLGTNTIISDSGWLALSGQRVALDRINAQLQTVSSKDRTRPLLDLIKQSALDAFKALGSLDGQAPPPLHQAMVILSSGYGGGDPSTTGPGASELSKYLSGGRLDAENNALPKMPIPIISIFTPPNAQPEHTQLARSFMENLANPTIGGFFSVIRDEQASHSARIVDAVRSRFAQMIVAKFAMSCVAPSTTQSFSLLFRNKSENILGDSSFSNVPLGFDPGQWPLDIDAELTRRKAQEQGGVRPSGTVRILGNFCWGNDLSRPEVYFIPPGENLPRDLSDQAAAQDVQKRLIALDMRGRALQVNSSFVEFKIPESNQILIGEGERRTVRLVVVDSKLRRTSGLTEATVLTLKAQDIPLPLLPIFIAAGGGGILLLGLGLLLRRGTKKATVSSSRGYVPSEGSPYARPAPVSRVPNSERTILRAVLEGGAGRFIVLAGTDLKAGRDSTRVAALLSHHQVSGLHATFRLEERVLKVRDESSTSGTRVDGRLIVPGTWEVVSDGAQVALGSEVLTARLEIVGKRS